MVKKEIIKKVREFRKALIRQRIRVAKIILYGSYASGKMHKGSDIDIAVISADFGKDRFNEGIKLFEIAYKIDPRFEPIPISLTSYKKDTWLPLIYEIRHRGIEFNWKVC
jgi:uncharacterized protein